MTNRTGEIVQHYGYTAFGDERYQQSTRAFNVTNRYTGQRIDEETGLYFYNSRYYDPDLGRFVQADSIVPSSDTSQALNRYAYVKNNPLNFTDPSGHGWFSKIWKHVKQWIGTIITVAFCMMGMPFLGAIIGSAIGTIVNGGTFKSFAIGVAVGFAAGCIGNALGGALTGPACGIESALGNAVGQGMARTMMQFAQGALIGAIAGGISSAIYGQNIGKGMGQGAIAGAIGSGVAMTAGAAIKLGIEAGKVVIAGMKATIQIVKVVMNAIYEWTTAIPYDIMFGPLATGTIAAASAQGPISGVTLKAYRFTDLLDNDYTPNGKEIHTSLYDLKRLDYAVNHGVQDRWVFSHFLHELGHIQQYREMGPINYLRVVLRTGLAQGTDGSYNYDGDIAGIAIKRDSSGMNRYEVDATRRAASMCIESFEVKK